MVEFQVGCATRLQRDALQQNYNGCLCLYNVKALEPWVNKINK